MEAEFGIGDLVIVRAAPRYKPECSIDRTQSYRDRKCIGKTGVIESDVTYKFSFRSEPLFKVRFDNEMAGGGWCYNVRQAWLDRIDPVDPVEVDEEAFSYES